MLEKLKETWSLLGVLRRILVTLSKAEKSLASLADSQALQIKLAVLQSGGSIEGLRAEPLPGEDEVLQDDYDADQDDEELANFERIEQDMRRRGAHVEEDIDLVALEKALLLLKSEQEKKAE